MLTLKQSPLAIIGIFLVCSLADGAPGAGKLTIAMGMLVLTILYVLVCAYVNQRRCRNEEM